MRWIAFTLMVSSIAGAQTTRPQTWDLQSGQWAPLTQPPSTQPVSDETLDQAQLLLSRHQYNPARQLLLRWLKLHPDSPIRDRALFLLADAYYQYGDRLTAFYQLDELLDNYPESALYYQSLEKQFQIADAYLRGYKRRILFMPILGAEDEAIEMLFRIQQRSPGSPIAEKSLLRTADYYYATSEFDFAGDAYAAYAKSYPRSPLLPKVRLREAFSSLARFRGLRF